MRNNEVGDRLLLHYSRAKYDLFLGFPVLSYRSTQQYIVGKYAIE